MIPRFTPQSKIWGLYLQLLYIIYNFLIVASELKKGQVMPVIEGHGLKVVDDLIDLLVGGHLSDRWFCGGEKSPVAPGPLVGIRIIA